MEFDIEAAPLLSKSEGSNERSDSNTQEGAAHLAILESSNAPNQRSVPTFLDGYEAVGGIPARVIRPCEGSAFYAYAFSADGSRLATGERNGTVCVWRTSNYSLVWEAQEAVPNGVCDIKFVSGSNQKLMSISDDSRIVELEFIPAENNTELSAAAPRKEVTIVRKEEELPYDGSYKNCELSHDGRILVCYDWETDPQILHVYKMWGVDCYQRCDLEETYRMSDPCPAPNGKSLLSCSFSKTDPSFDYSKCTVHVWPELDFDQDQQQMTTLDDDRAVWGLNGEYLLAWKSSVKRPRLSVYKTENLCYPDNEANHPPAIRMLEAELAHWTAIMLDRQDSHLGPSVLIQEIAKSGKRRFLIWDIRQDAIVNEVDMAMHLQRSIDLTKYFMWAKTADQIVEQKLPVTSWQSHDLCLSDDLYSSKLCASSDGQFVGAVSLRKQSCAISSLASGATIWNFAFPEEIEMDPTGNIAVTFDQTGRHFTVIGSDAIIAWAPCFLQSNDVQQVKTLTIPPGNPLDGIARNESLYAVFNTLSSSALGQAVARRIRDGMSEVGLGCLCSERPDIGCLRVGLSADRLRSVIIPVAHNTLVYSYPDDYCPKLQAFFLEGRKTCAGLMYEDVEAELFPLDYDEFEPAQVFLHKKANGTDVMVLFEKNSGPTAVFCDLSSKMSKIVELQMEECRRISQTADQESLVMLDRHGVCILDLQNQGIVKKIPYTANISKLFELVEESMKWPYKQRFDGDLDPNPRISDAGDAVLLGWDTQNRRSIVLLPSTLQSNCEELIKAAEGSLSDFCVLSRNAQCTLFVDVNELPTGTLTVGIFNQSIERVICRVHVLHNLATTGMSAACVGMMASCLHYDLSPDGSEVITYVGMKDTDELTGKNIEERIQVFSLYGTADCLPEYDRLILRKNTSVQQSVDEIFATSGSCTAFNMPVSEGKSILQEAFVNKDHEMVDRITDIADREGCELACDWTSPDGVSCNLLKEALSTKSPNEVKKAGSLIGSALTPFIRAAKAMKDCFKDVLIGHPRIVEGALKNNSLVIKACQFMVHIDYTDGKLRQDTAVHVDTSDTIAEWTHNNDPDSLAATWRAKNAEAVEQMEKNGNKSTAEASLMYVCIENAAKVGMDGILRPLLFQNMPEWIFNSDTVKWIVMYKWLKIWKPRFIKTAVFYAAFLLLFAIYAILVAVSAEMPDKRRWRTFLSTAILPALFGFGAFMLKEEITQVVTLVKDGIQHFDSPKWGLAYFFSSRWNWVDLCSSAMLLAFIPLFHLSALFSSKFDNWLSAIIAIEALLATSKVWYFAQPFRRTGALVLMIDNVIKDCIAFLALAFVVLFGFALALHVLFRRVPTETGGDMLSDDSEIKDEHHPFGTYRDSLLALFYALLGAFEPDVFRVEGPLSWLIILTFVAYLAAETIVLLNLLIALMGDTFDKVKDSEEAQLLLGRAKFIDACEAALSETQKNEMNNSIGKYVHAIVSIEGEPNMDETDVWPGRLKKLERIFRTSVKESEQRVKESMSEKIATLEETVSEKKEALDGKVEALEGKMSDLNVKMEALDGKMSEKVEALATRIEQLSATTAHQLETITSLLEAQKDA